MSKVTIAGDANGTGVFTIAAPNGNTNRTLVLPDEAGTVLTSAGVPSSAMPAGSVLQVLQAVKTDVFSATATAGSWIDITGLSVSITTASASSKILVFADVALGTSGDATGQPFLRLVRNSTAIYIGDASGIRVQAMSGNSVYGTGIIYKHQKQNGVYLDSPASSSSITYKLQLGVTASVTSYVNRNGYDANRWEDARLASSITIMEIAA